VNDEKRGEDGRTYVRFRYKREIVERPPNDSRLASVDKRFVFLVSVNLFVIHTSFSNAL